MPGLGESIAGLDLARTIRGVSGPAGPGLAASPTRVAARWLRAPGACQQSAPAAGEQFVWAWGGDAGLWTGAHYKRRHPGTGLKTCRQAMSKESGP